MTPHEAEAAHQTGDKTGALASSPPPRDEVVSHVVKRARDCPLTTPVLTTTEWKQSQTRGAPSVLWLAPLAEHGRTSRRGKIPDEVSRDYDPMLASK
eukprot:CAMPEP_0118978402 /NCGR_PEP_ID=MMETSP1173-20130426/23564_1 /TAXON_ID=1034831 /ORGANISM="Rhizochromulina marina cf, Strain CCMP1243" /LENGTH=96 /DNA_ID=CAMNT_0006928595 /DNA_START=23 /DNA_END=315 /DNA_ORIENTATION=+